MTQEQFGLMVEQDDVLNVLRKKMEREYPKYSVKVEDWVSRAVAAGLKKCAEFQSTSGALFYMVEKIVFIAMEDIEREAERRAILRGLPRYNRRHDPMRAIDFKVDLENGIRDTIGVPVMRTVLWHIVYEKFTWDEALDLLPGYKTRDAWEHVLRDCMRALKQEMKRKGYRL